MDDDRRPPGRIDEGEERRNSDALHPCAGLDRSDPQRAVTARRAPEFRGQRPRGPRTSTISRVTLIFVADNQNITLSLPRTLLKRVKRVAADRDTSVSALMAEALDRLADEDRRYSAARKRAVAALRSAGSLGTRGRRTWSRDDLHDR